MKFTRILSAALAGVMVFSCAAALGGCRKKQEAVKTTVDHVYRVTRLERPEGMNYAQQLFAAGDRIYMSYNYFDNEKNLRENRTYSISADGTDLKREELAIMNTPVSEDENTYINLQNFAAAEDGSIWRVLYYSTYNMQTGEAIEKHYLQRMTMDGKELLNLDCEKIWGPPAENPNERVWHYIDFMIPMTDGVVFTDNQTLYYLSGSGEVKARIDMMSVGGGNGWVNSVFSTESGPVILYADYTTSQQKLSLIPVDIAAGKTGTPVELDSAAFRNVYNFYSGPGYTFYYGTDEALFGYDMASGTSTMLMNYMNSDISANTVSRLVVLSPDLFVVNGYDDVTSQQELMMLKRVPEEELVPQYVLTLASIGDPWSAQSDVIRFNRLGTEYRITLKNYDPADYYVDTTAEYNYQELVQQALNALNNDIIAGRIPDILLVNEYVQMDNYISKGIFADLNKFIDSDERFKREDFLTNILDAFSIGGKLYEITPSFNVQTLVGKKSMIGDRTGWTMKEFVEWTKTIPEGAAVFYDITRDTLLDMFCTYAYEEFVDTDTGKCYFDSEDFKLVLEYVNTLATKSIWEMQEEGGSMDNNFWQEYEYRFRDDRAMLEQLYLSNFTAIPSTMSYTFYSDEELVMVGLPSMDRRGAVITANPSYAISAQSPLTDGAWQFVSMFLTAEYQDDLTYNFPLRIDSLEKMAAKQVEEQQKQKKQYEERMQNQGGDFYYGGAVTMPAVQAAPAILAETTAVTAAIAETEAVVTESADTKPAKPEAPAETTGPADANGDGIMDDDIAVIDPVLPVQRQDVRVFLDQEMADEMIAFLKTLNHARRNNTKVNNIIKEEAAAYFAGNKSLDETVKLIQNRVSTLVAESR